MTQRFWHDVAEGDELQSQVFPITVYRLVMAAGANRDFNAIHTNPDVAKQTGAPDIYANTLLLQGMWEKTVRQFIGLAGRVRSQKGFRMSSFNHPGDTVVVKGRVARTWQEDSNGLIEIEIWSENSNGVSVGPGRVIAELPLQQD